MNILLVLFRWLEGVDAEPGLNQPMINALVKNKENDPDKYTK